MKRIIIILFLMMAYSGYAQKVGVVLSGGGAKGLAHIGVLKALEENNIPIDYITGTSMGGIVGAMYAAGYSPKEIEKIALSTDFQDWVSGKFTSDYSYYFQKNGPNASVITAKLEADTSLRLSLRPNIINDIPLNFALLELFSQASSIAKDNFDNLFVPFRCMVSDIISQKSIAVKNGSLADAVRATMTVPMIYRPIKIDEKYVFDGGLYNNFPADIMKTEFKPDYIIGANVSSKVFTEYPKDDEKVLNRFLLYMLLSKSDSTLIGDHGIYIQPNLSNFNSANFSPVAEIINQGYIATLAEIDKIKHSIKRDVDPWERAEKRKEFNAKKPNLSFSSVKVSGVNSQQKKYIERLFKNDQQSFNLLELKKRYYKLVADETFETIYPKISYDLLSDSYQFEIVAEPKKSFKIDFGGNISTRPISNVYLGIQYNYLNKKAYAFGTNFYSGRFYESFQINGRVDYSSTLPLFIATEFTYNHWNYYNTSDIFVENPKPTYIEQADRKFDIKLGFPLNRNARIILNGALFNNSDNYSPTNSFSLGDVLDRSVFNGIKTSLSFEQNSLNRKQYATAGKLFSAGVSYTAGRQTYTPGWRAEYQYYLPNYLRTHRDWFTLKLSTENYFLKLKKYTLGYLLEVVISDQPLFNDYYTSLLVSPSFFPLQDSKSLFLHNFRASSYLAGGLKHVYSLKKNLDLRLESFLFVPYQKLKSVNMHSVSYQKKLSEMHYAGTAGLVYHSPLGPVSLSYNLYNDPLKRHGVLLHLGYLIYNKRSIE